jgi:hypothetical protein
LGAATETAVAKVTIFMDVFAVVVSVAAVAVGVSAGDSLMSLFSVISGDGKLIAGHAKDHTGMDMGGGGGIGLLLLLVAGGGFDATQKAVGIVICRLTTAWWFLWPFLDPAATYDPKIMHRDNQRMD